MSTTRRTAVRVTSALLLLSGWGLAPPSAAAHASRDVVADERRIVLVDVPADDAALVGWAVGLFR